MDRVYLRGQRDLDDRIDIQIRIDRAFAGIQRIRFIGLGTEKSIADFRGIDADGGDAKFGQRTEDADRDLTSIRDQDLFERSDLCFIMNY